MARQVIRIEKTARDRGIERGLAIAAALDRTQRTLLAREDLKQRKKSQELNTLLRAVDMFGGDANTAPPAMRNRLSELLGAKDLPIAGDGGVKFPTSQKVEIEKIKNTRILDVFRRAAAGDEEAIQERAIMEGLASPDISEGEKELRRELSQATTNRTILQHTLSRERLVFKTMLDIKKEMIKAGMKPENEGSGFTLMRDKNGDQRLVDIVRARALRPDVTHKELTYGQADAAQDLVNSISGERLRQLNVAGAKLSLLKQLRDPTAMDVLKQLTDLSEAGVPVASETLDRLMDDVMGEMLAERHNPALIDDLPSILGESSFFESFFKGDLPAKNRAIRRVNRAWDQAINRNLTKINIIQESLKEPFTVEDLDDTTDDRSPQGATREVDFQATSDSAFSGDEAVITPEQRIEIDRMITLGASQGFSSGEIIANIVRAVGSSNPGVRNAIAQRVETLMRDQLVLNPPKPE